MNTEKIYKLHSLLSSRRTAVRADVLTGQLECSRRTVDRYIRFMREQLGAPIEYVDEYQGYQYSKEGFELPGLWFSSDEVLALVTLKKLMVDLGAGLLDQLLSPFKHRIDQILEAKHLGAGQLQRIKLQLIAARSMNPIIFKQVAAALLQRKQLRMSYQARSDGRLTERTVSPQRLLYYRGNWHLDAWCHNKRALRNFSVDGIQNCDVMASKCIDVADLDLELHYAQSYGIFAGEPRYEAVLRFSPYRARWVASEIWHPKQVSTWHDDGSYELRFPYSDERELIGDIMRHLPDVQVISPVELKQAIKNRIQHALELFK